MSRPHTPLILRLTAGKIPPLLVGLFVSLALTLILSGVFIIEDIPLTWHNYSITAYFTFTFGYVVYISRIIQKNHQRNFDKLLLYADLETSEKDGWKERISTYDSQRRELLVALLVGALHAYFGIFNAVLSGEVTYSIYETWRSIQIVLVWLLITQATSTYTRNMTLMNMLSRHIKVDLLNMDKLVPLTQSGIVSILAFIGAYSMLFMNDIDISSLTNPAMIVLVPSIVWMIITPLRGVRKRVIAAKHHEIELVDRAIEGDMSALKDSRIRNNLENINVIDLINYKKSIQNTFEIPVNIPTASRFLFYLIIPLLTWIAASIVDKVIDYLIK